MIASLRLIAPWSEWLGYLRDANPLWLLLAPLLVLPHVVLRALRFERLLPELREHRGPHLRLTYAMTCVGQLPVGTIGGDAYRIVKFTCLGVPAERGTASTAILRVAGFAVTLGVAGALGAVFMGSVLPLIGVAVCALVYFLLGTSGHPPNWVSRLTLDPDTDTPEGAGVWRRATDSLRRVLWRTIDQSRDLQRRDLFAVFALTLGLIALKALMLMLCAWALGLDIGPLGAAFALVAGNLMCTIPSPAGTVGLREGGIVGAFAILGAASTPATVAALFFRAALIVGSLIGWGLSLLFTRSAEEVFAESGGDAGADAASLA